MPSPPPTKAALAAHAQACERRESGYIDPDIGLFVLTSHYLREQGRCCARGCRHCPWPERVQDAVDRPPRPCWPYPPPS